MESDIPAVDPIDKKIAAIAAKQRGYITRWQLLKLGLGEKAIYYRIRAGRLIRVFPGVYAVGHRRNAPIDLAAAAVLACGPGAVLSDLSAAALWGFVKQWPDQPEVSVTLDRRPKGIRTSRRDLPRRDNARHLGIPVTTPARTVLDCAPRVRNPVRFVNDALHSPWLTESQLIEASEHHARARLVRAIVLGQPGVTRSELEDRFVVFCRRHGLPQPEINAIVDGREVDAFFRAERVIVELDGYEFHSDKATFERDREKDAEAAAKGLLTVRLTDERMKGDPVREASRLRGILKDRRRPSA